MASPSTSTRTWSISPASCPAGSTDPGLASLRFTIWVSWPRRPSSTWRSRPRSPRSSATVELVRLSRGPLLETDRRLLGGGLAGDAGHPGQARALAADGDHLLDDRGLASEEGFHAAVLAVAHPAAQATLDRLLHRPGAIPDSLDLAPDANQPRRHSNSRIA